MQTNSPRTQRTVLSAQVAALFLTGAGLTVVSQPASAQVSDPCVILDSAQYTAGNEPQCAPGAYASTAGGWQADVNSPESVAIGWQAQTTASGPLNGIGQVAIGAGATTGGTRSVAVGHQAGGVGGSLSTAQYATMIGGLATSHADGGTAVGDGAQIGGVSVNATVLGRNSGTANTPGGVALGYSSISRRAAITNVLDPLTGLLVTTTTGGVSIGDSKTSLRRQITDVANGTDDYDAVNVSQVRKVKEDLEAKIGTGATGNYVAYDDASKTSVTMGGVGAVTPVTITNVAAGVNPTDAVNFGQLTTTNNQVSSNTTNIANNTSSINTLFADALLLDPTKTFYDSKNKKIQNVADGEVSLTSKDAVNGSQLKAVQDQITAGVTGNFVAYDDLSKSSVTLGGAGAAGEVTLTNVKAGVNTTDAVNFGQLTATNNQVANNTTNIANNTSSINTLFADALLLDPTKSFYDAGRTGKNLTIQNLAPGVNGTDAVNVDQLKAVEAKIGSGTTLDAVLYDDASHGQITLVGTGGSKTTPVKIGNVAEGTAPTDAVNFGQLTQTNNQVASNTTNIATNTSNIATNTSNIANNTSNINTLFADALLLDPTKTFYDSKNRKIQNVADGDISVTSKDAVNGSQLKALQDQITAGVTGNFVAYDDLTKSSVTLGGVGAASEIVLTNVAAGVNPTDAVNFGQLTQTNNQVANNTTNIANNTSNINSLFADALLLDPTKTFYDSKNRKIQNVADGEISLTSKDAVNGSQLKAIDDKITAVAGGNFVSYDDAGKTSVTLGGVGAADTVQLTNVKEAVLSATSKDAVNGSQLFTTNQNVTKNTTDITTLFNTTLQFNGSYYDAGNRIIRNVATPVQGSDAVNKDYVDNKIGGVTAALDGVVKYDDATKDTVTLEGTNGTKITNVADGAIATGSKDAINGGQLKDYGDSILNQANTYTDNKINQISQVIADSPFKVNVTTMVAPNASGANSVAGGSGSVASGGNSMAVGNNSTASGQSSTALGNGAVSSGNNSVALGAGSNDGGRENVVAIGNRIVSNMADGVQSSDGATVGQLRASTAQANQYTDERVNALHGDIDKLERRSNSGIASAIALQAPAQYAPGATTVRVGTGYYGKQVALGVSFRTTAENGRWSITGGVSGGRYGGVAAGAGVEFVLK